MRRARTDVLLGTVAGLAAVLSFSLNVACSFSSAGGGGGGGTGGDDSGSETDDASGGATEGATEATTSGGSSSGSGATDGATGSTSSTGAPTTGTPSTSDASTGVTTTSSTTAPETTGCAATPWYPDGDNDGYGAGEPVESCEPLDGHADKPGDCDDNNDAISPGVDEICDDEDNNCNSLTDEWSPANVACHGCVLATYDERFYTFCEFERDWEPAREDCEWRGGDLVIIEDQAENDFVFVEAFKVQPGSWWLGGRRNNNNWYWVDGQKVEDGYQNWTNGEPEGLFDNSMALEDMGEWWSKDNNAERRFVCEITPP